MTGRNHKLKKHRFDWIIVGGGAAGISIAEMLSRLNLEVLLIEKNEKLASETSGLFHEWLHTGSLYTLTPDNLETTKYLLGALDDLFIYYSMFNKMNLVPTESGFVVEKNGWFNDDNILYKFKARPLNPLWSFIVARSIRLVDEIKCHDWLRQRAGSKFNRLELNIRNTLKYYPTLLDGFTELLSPDITINSRILLSDLIFSFEKNHGKILTNTEVKRISDNENKVVVETNNGEFNTSKAVLCCADGISKFTKTSLNISYAPMFVVKSEDEAINSFVELDIIIKNCINMIKKSPKIGLAGGISVNKKSEIEDYSNFCINSHLKIDKSLLFVDRYIGLKKELVRSGKNRNYLFHIDNYSENVWSVVLGKFTLLFSLAPEFIRRVYKKNININTYTNQIDVFTDYHDIVSERTWEQIIKKKES